MAENRDNVIESLAICYTTFNSMKTMPDSIEAARKLSNQIVVIDSGSTDGTIDLCKNHGIEVHHREWTTPTEQKEFALSFCKEAKWVLLLDSDEIVLDELARSIRGAISTSGDEDTGFAVNRMIWFYGKPLKHAFQKEWRLRLVRPPYMTLESDPSGVHDRIEITQGKVKKLRGVLRHNSWVDASDMLHSGARWGSVTGAHATKGGHVWNLMFNPSAAFIKQYVFKLAFLDGWRGLVVSAGVASQTLIKHTTTMANRKRRK